MFEHNKDVKGHSYTIMCVKMNLVEKTMIVTSRGNYYIDAFVLIAQSEY